ncbi:MAG TPA: thiamine pyrophosphate-dependent enzyme [Chloroflexota bacterium]|nr:thiamine pyrophosphate-dependent enzyme [Chloroflexota bacterium]
MKRIDCISALNALVTDELVVTTLSGTKAEWGVISGEDREANLLLGSMGNVTAVGLGLALSLPNRKVIVLESDGSVLMDLACLTVIGTYQPANLTVVVFDNELYSGSRISQPTATAFRTSIEAMARGAGIEAATTIRELDAFERAAAAALAGPGPHYIVAKVEEDLGGRRLRPRLNLDHLENKYRFQRYLERIEGRQILPSERPGQPTRN